MKQVYPLLAIIANLLFLNVAFGHVKSDYDSFATGDSINPNSPNNSLPVMYDKVKAYTKSSGVEIEWSNLTERDLIAYDVEHSVDGRNFSVIAHVLPKYNDNDVASYAEFHSRPAGGTNYYRVKAIEKNGKLIYTHTLRVETDDTKQKFTVYPQPVTNNQFTLWFNNLKQGQYTVRIIGITGADLYKQSIITQSNSVTQVVKLPAGIKPGIYSLLVSGADFAKSETIVVQ